MSDLRRLSNDAVLDMSTGMYTNPLCYTPEADADAVRAWIRSIPPLVAPVQAEAYAPEHDAAHLDRWLTVARDEADTLRAKLAEVERERDAAKASAAIEVECALGSIASAAGCGMYPDADTIVKLIGEMKSERDAAIRGRDEAYRLRGYAPGAISRIVQHLGLTFADTYSEQADAIIAAIGKLRDEAKAARKACPVDVSTLRLLRASGLFGNEINTLAGWALEEEARR